MGFTDLFKKKAIELPSENIGGIPVFRGHDPNAAFKGRTVSNMAQAEAWFHGGNLPGQKDWYLLNKDQINRPAAEIVSQIVEQERVSNVLLTSCNVQQNLIRTPKNATVTYGLGYGLHTDRAREGMGLVRSWGEGVVVSQGDTSKIFTKSAMMAEMERRGLDTSVLASFHQTGLKGESLGSSTAIGVFSDATGKQRISVNAAAQTAEEVMKYSLPMEEAPHIAAAFGRDISFSTAGKSFSSLAEANQVLTESLKGKSRMANAAAGFLQRAGIGAKPLSVAVAGETIAAEATEVAAVEKSAGRAFGGKSYAGILIGGVLALGAAITVKGWKQINDVEDEHHNQKPWNYKVPSLYQAPIQGPNETFSINRSHQDHPEGSTEISFHDAQINHAGIEEAFTKHLKYGLARSSR